MFVLSGCATVLERPTAQDAHWVEQQGAHTNLAGLQAGRNLYVSRCAACHSLRLPEELTPAEWPRKVEDMGERAHLDRGQRQLVAWYLTSTSARLRGEKPAATEVAEESASPEHWRVQQVEGESGTELHVVRADGTAVAFGEGLSDVGLGSRLRDRATALEGGGLSAMLVRWLALGAGGVIALAGVAAGVAGIAVWSLARSGRVEGVPSAFDPVMENGPSILLTGAIAVGVGLATSVAGGGVWAWSAFRDRQMAADPEVLSALALTQDWDEPDAREVVRRHNARTVTAAP
jgi:hypothetical protein